MKNIIKNVVRKISNNTQFSKSFDGNIYPKIDQIITSKLQGKKVTIETNNIDLAVHTYQIQEVDIAGSVEVRVEDPWNTYISSDNNSLIEKITELVE